MIEYSASNSSEVLNKFLCPVCCEVVSRPKQTPCKHIFCHKCLKLWLENSLTCPLCRDPLQLKMVRSPPRQFQSDLSNLRVRCSFNGKGCSEEMELKKLSRHERVCKYRGPRCGSHVCKRPLQLTDDHDEPAIKMKKFCSKSCLEEYVMHNYIVALKRMKKWRTLLAQYKSCTDIESERDFYHLFSATIVLKLQDVEIKVTNKIKKLYAIPESEEEMDRRWGILVKRLLDKACSHVATLMPESDIRLETNPATANSVKLIRIHYTPRFHDSESNASSRLDYTNEI